jgi:hypothetical protein
MAIQLCGCARIRPGPEVLARRRLQTIAGQIGNDPKGNTEICKDRFAPARISFNRGGFHDPKGDLLRQRDRLTVASVRRRHDDVERCRLPRLDFRIAGDRP